jgi:hypothetical protein
MTNTEKLVTDMVKSKDKKLPDLPIELILYILRFSGFRETFILHFLIAEIRPKYYIEKYGSLTLEYAVDNNRIYEVIFRLWIYPQPMFRHTILIARAIRMKKWLIVRSLITIFKSKSNIWDIVEAIKLGIDPITLNIMIKSFDEVTKEKLRVVCLLQSEIHNNVDVFLYILKELEFQRRRHRQVRKILNNMENKQWLTLIKNL